MEVYDFCGKKIEVGATIVYPVRRRSEMWLKKIVVTGIEQRASGPGLVGYDPDSTVMRQIRVKNIDTVVVV